MALGFTYGARVAENDTANSHFADKPAIQIFTTVFRGRGPGGSLSVKTLRYPSQNYCSQCLASFGDRSTPITPNFQPSTQRLVSKPCSTQLAAQRHLGWLVYRQSHHSHHCDDTSTTMNHQQPHCICVTMAKHSIPSCLRT